MISGVDVSRETLERLGAFEDLVRKWTKKINLIARNDVDHIWDRHLGGGLVGPSAHYLLQNQRPDLSPG